MRTLVIEKPGRFSFKEVDRVENKKNIEIKVRSIGICGSEISAYKGTFPLGDFPRSLGHEIGGEVVYAPENGKGIKVGDRVTVEPYRFCGKCYPCSQGKTNACEDLKVIGVHQDGAHSEYYSHEVSLVHKVPESMPFYHIALVETLTISIHGVHRSRVKKGEFAVVTGAGAIGLLAAQYVNHLGATAIVIDPINARLNIARNVGVQHCINPMEEDAIQRIHEITEGRMAEAGIECSGAKPAIRSMIDYVAYTGRISLVGYPGDDTPLPTFLFTKKELDVLGSRNSVEEFPLAIKLISNGSINVEELITKKISFDQMPEFFKKIMEKPGSFMKVVAEL